jgi:hypothetical protein
MRAVLTVLALAGACAATYVPVPGVGRVRADCVSLDIPHGTHIERRGASHDVLHFPDGTSRVQPSCVTNTADPRPLIQVRTANDDFLPANYDGWEQYAAWQHDPTLTSFLGNFSVPDLPAAAPEVLYIFTGLQNINWIPKVDPIPTEAFDIIQPVLQYPGTSTKDWAIRSWYVTLKGQSYASTPVSIQPGDVIFGNMTMIANASWIIVSQSTQTGKATSLHASGTKVVTQPWAYVTIECYGCNGCSTYPTQPSAFTAMTFTDENFGPIAANWTANPQPDPKLQCHEKTDIISPAAVTFSFQ